MGKEKTCPGRSAGKPAADQMRHRRSRTANDASRLSVSLALSRFQLILPKIDPQSGGCCRRRFFRSAAAFSQQIPKVICERSCRMAKTLIVKITLKGEKKSGKPKKNQKKIDILADSREKTLKKHMDPVRFRLFPFRPARPVAERYRPEKAVFRDVREDGRARTVSGKDLTFQGKRRILYMDILFHFWKDDPVWR